MMKTFSLITSLIISVAMGYDVTEHAAWVLQWEDVGCEAVVWPHDEGDNPHWFYEPCNVEPIERAVTKAVSAGFGLDFETYAECQAAGLGSTTCTTIESWAIGCQCDSLKCAAQLTMEQQKINAEAGDLTEKCAEPLKELVPRSSIIAGQGCEELASLLTEEDRNTETITYEGCLVGGAFTLGASLGTAVALAFIGMM
eukprot:GHVN01079655.1.p1 GENE.GHVN01079655.1~~GHVN01079655.1.p1  ORF type:complete len:198 (-),score=20.60 GHVN01079655.1:916-1509(-)